MRTAIIGTGFVAEVHAESLKKSGHTLAAVVGSTLVKAEQFAGRWGAERFGSEIQVALTHDIDCIHICTPPALHYEMVRQTLLFGKHVLCEKPLCLSAAESKELANLLAEKNLVGAVNFNVRFHEALISARKTIVSGETGKICLVHGSYLQEYHALPCEYGWRYQPGLAGRMRAVTEIGSHWIDLARFLTNLEVVSVSANFGNFSPCRYLNADKMTIKQTEKSQKVMITSEDAAVISLKFSNGAIGSLFLSEVSHGRKNDIHIEVTGVNKSVWWYSQEPQNIHEGEKDEEVSVKKQTAACSFSDTFTALFTEVYKDIAAGTPNFRPSYPTFQDGYVNAAVCEAVYTSASQQSKWVNVSDHLL
jgi:predicted dehydrogenase